MKARKLLALLLLIVAVVILAKIDGSRDESRADAGPVARTQETGGERPEPAIVRREPSSSTPPPSQTVVPIKFTTRTADGGQFLGAVAVEYSALAQDRSLGPEQMPNESGLISVGVIPAGEDLVISFYDVPRGGFTAIGPSGARVRGVVAENEVVFSFPTVGRIIVQFGPHRTGVDYQVILSTGLGAIRATTSDSPYICDRAPHGWYQIRVSGAGETGHFEFYHLSDEDIVEVILVPSRTLLITVRDASSRELIPTAEVLLNEVYGQTVEQISPGQFSIPDIAPDTRDFLIRARSDSHPEQQFDILMPESGFTHEYDAYLREGFPVRFLCEYAGTPVPGVRGLLQYRHQDHATTRRALALGTARASGDNDGIVEFQLPLGVTIDTALFVSDFQRAVGALPGNSISLDAPNKVVLEANRPIKISFQDPGGPRPIRLNVLSVGAIIGIDGLPTNYYLNSADVFLLDCYPLPRARLRVESQDGMPLARKDIDGSTSDSLTITLPALDSFVVTILNSNLEPQAGILEVYLAENGVLLQSLTLDAQGVGRIQINEQKGVLLDIRIRLPEERDSIHITRARLGSRPQTYRRQSFGWPAPLEAGIDGSRPRPGFIVVASNG